MAMPYRIKQLWLSALRNGKYEQGRNFLNNDGKFCCLGVLCDIAVKEGVIKEVDPYHGNGTISTMRAYEAGTHAETTVLPRAVSTWAGLPSNNPYYYQGGDTVFLAGMNDQGIPFEDIADAIEEHL